MRMGKQELSLKVVPDNATHKGLVVTLADSSLASITPTANGVELDARKGGTTSLEVESHHGEVTKTIPVNVSEATDLLVDGKLNTGARYVKDFGAENEILNYLNVPRHRSVGNHTISGMLMSTTDGVRKFTATREVDPYYRPIDWATSTTSPNSPLKRETTYTIAFNYNASSGSYLRLRCIFNPTTYAYFEGSGRACVTFTTGATGGQYLSFDTVTEKSDSKNAARIDDWFELSKIILVEGQFSSLPYYPAPEDVGVVSGQENIFSESTVTVGKYPSWWTDDLTIQAYRWTSDFISVKTGDVISFAKLKSVGNGHNLIVKLYDADGNGVYLASTNALQWVLPTGAGRTVTVAKGELPPIPEGVVKMRVGGLRDDTSTGVMTLDEVKSLGLKVIKGSLSAMDHWTPTQSDSGLTIVNNGIVSFNSTDYANILAKDQVVRAETKVYNRGACIDLSFNVIEAISTKYPTLFAGLTTIDQKIAKYHTLRRNVYIVQSSRGYGYYTGTENNWTLRSASLGSILTKNGSSLWGLGSRNDTANFTETGTILSDTVATQINAKGCYVIRVGSHRNNTTDAGVVSDGVTPAWVEVKDARLEVSIQPPEDPNAKPITITVTPS